MHLITGGAGFIGSHLAGRLCADGHNVRVFDNFSTGRRENLGEFETHLELAHGDLRDPDVLRNAMSGVEVVFHLAADPSVTRSIANPRPCYEANVIGTLNVLQAAREAGVRRVVFASSCFVYGDAPGLPKAESSGVAPGSPYAASKLAGEQLCQLFTRSYGVETVVLRYFGAFGPRQHPESIYAPMILQFISALLSGGRPLIYGDGGQTRDYIYIEDLVDASLLAATSPEAAGNIFNVASGRSVTINYLLEVIGSALGVHAEPIYAEDLHGNLRYSAADISALQSLGMRPAISIEEGLRRTIAALG